MKIDWKKPWLKGILEDARKEVAARPKWMNELHGREFLKSIEEETKRHITEPEGDESFFYE